MPKLQKKATKTTKAKKKLIAPTKKKAQSTCKWKPENSDSEDSSDTESTHPPHKKHAKQPEDVEIDIVDKVDEGPKVVIDVLSGSNRDDTQSSDNEVWRSPNPVTQTLTWR